MGAAVAFEEKSAWIMLVLAVTTYSGYLVTVWRSASDTALVDVPYIAPMLWAIGISIGASIVIHIALGAFSERFKDQRDREIYQSGERIGQSFIVIGALAALLLAMAEVSYFWIANAVCLAFFLSAVLSSIARICFYRFGFPR